MPSQRAPASGLWGGDAPASGGGSSSRYPSNVFFCSSGVSFTINLLSANVYARVCTGRQFSARTTRSSGPESRGRWITSGLRGSITPIFFFPQVTIAFFVVEGRTVTTIRTFGLGGFGASTTGAGGALPASGPAA